MRFHIDRHISLIASSVGVNDLEQDGDNPFDDDDDDSDDGPQSELWHLLSEQQKESELQCSLVFIV